MKSAAAAARVTTAAGQQSSATPDLSAFSRLPLVHGEGHCRRSHGQPRRTWTELVSAGMGHMQQDRRVDARLLSHAALRSHIREMHPEVCFWGLNGGQPMLHSLPLTNSGFKWRCSTAWLPGKPRRGPGSENRPAPACVLWTRIGALPLPARAPSQNRSCSNSEKPCTHQRPSAWLWDGNQWGH